MKRLFLLVAILYAVSIFGSTGLLVEPDTWYSEIDVPILNASYLTANLTGDSLYAGPSFKLNWEDYSTGFLKVKTGTGFINGGLLFSQGKYMLYGKYMSSSNKVPVFSYNYADFRLFSEMDYSLYTRSWYRLPLGSFNGGISFINYQKDSFNFTDTNFYVYSKELDRSARLRSFDDSIGAVVDLKSTDSLGEMGYGAGLGLDYKSMDLGLCLAGSFIIPLEEFRMILSPVMLISANTFKTQIVLSKLGADETVTAGIVADGFSLDSFFVRVEFR